MSRCFLNAAHIISIFRFAIMPHIQRLMHLMGARSGALVFVLGGQDAWTCCRKIFLFLILKLEQFLANGHAEAFLFAGASIFRLPVYTAPFAPLTFQICFFYASFGCATYLLFCYKSILMDLMIEMVLTDFSIFEYCSRLLRLLFHLEKFFISLL